MFFGLFSSHLPFIILGVAYFMTFAFASVQRMANADDHEITTTGSEIKIAELSEIHSFDTFFPSGDKYFGVNQQPKIPVMYSFASTDQGREKQLLLFADHHPGKIFTRPPPSRT